MGFRFRRSIRLMRGVRINLSKSGPSLSVGGKGFTYNISGKGQRTTIGIPGTGLSYSSYTPHAKRSTSASSAPPIPNPTPTQNTPPPAPIVVSPPSYNFAWIGLAIILLIALLALS